MTTIPEQLLNTLDGLPGFEREAFIQAHNEENRITSVRMNPFKKVETGLPLGNRVPWAEEGFYLTERPSFTHDPLFHAGCYYVQEPGSMFLGYALREVADLSKPLKILDLCASPGGKSTHINSLINSESILVANEVGKSRAAVLTDNLGRWGSGNTIVTNSSPEKFGVLGEYFDIVVADAPCSGSGLLRKQPDAAEEWSPAAVTACALRQKEILARSLDCLKTNGILIYSTCSYSTEENESVVELLMHSGYEQVELSVPENWGIVSGIGYRFYPHKVAAEGFYLAVLKKTSESGQQKQGQKPIFHALKPPESIKLMLDPDPELEIYLNNGFYHLVNRAVLDFVNRFYGKLYFRKTGTSLGEMKGSDFVPAQDLSWSINLARDIPHVELDRELALDYLRKTLGALTGSTGLHHIRYMSQGIGWAKILKGRINNYLPSHIRILK